MQRHVLTVVRAILAITIAMLLLTAVVGILPVHAATQNSWITKAPMHQANAGFGAVSVNDEIYVIGGSNDEGHPNFSEEYNPTTNTWTDKAPLHFPRTNLA